MLDQQTITRRSLRSRVVNFYLRRKLKPRLTGTDFDPVRFRGWLERQMARQFLSKGVAISEVNQPGVRGEWHTPQNAQQDTCMLYLHGGGYLFGSPRTYRGFTTRLAKLSNAAVFSLEYRLAPEDPFPAAVDDALAAYQMLLQRFAPGKIVLAGDSAGAGLALALVHALRQRAQRFPGGVIAMSPYGDLLTTGASLTDNSESCVMFDAACIRHAAEIYLNGTDGASPLASPLYGDYVGFPPLLIYVSDNEVLRDDGLRIAAKADEAGAPVTLRIWQGQAHVWPVFYPFIPEADLCIREMAVFADKCWRQI